MDKLSLKYLAQRLGLGISTVSRALRDTHDVSEATKKRVKAMADEMGFRPNPYAGSLRNNRTRTIAAVVPEIENSFFSQVINGIQSVAIPNGYHVLIYLTHEDFHLEQDIVRLLKNGRVDGLIISVADTTASFNHIDVCRQAGLKVVLFDRVAGNTGIPSITTDDAAISLQATEHLLQSGCKRIAFLSPSPSLSITRRRLSGYYSALQKSGADSWHQVVHCGTSDERNDLLISELLQRPDRPDGIFAATERFAISTYRTCDRLGIKIPDDLKVIGFSNLPASELFHPPLSSIMQPALDIGKEAVTLLFKLLENKALFACEENIVIPSKMIIRKSSC